MQFPLRDGCSSSTGAPLFSRQRFLRRHNSLVKALRCDHLLETFVARFSTLVQQSEAYRSFERKNCRSIFNSCAVVCGLWIVCNFLSEMLMIEAAPVFTNQRFLRRQKSLVKLCGGVIVCKDLLLDSRFLCSRLRLIDCLQERFVARFSILVEQSAVHRFLAISAQRCS